MDSRVQGDFVARPRLNHAFAEFVPELDTGEIFFLGATGAQIKCDVIVTDDGSGTVWANAFDHTVYFDLFGWYWLYSLLTQFDFELTGVVDTTQNTAITQSCWVNDGTNTHACDVDFVAELSVTDVGGGVFFYDGVATVGDPVITGNVDSVFTNIEFLGPTSMRYSTKERENFACNEL